MVAEYLLLYFVGSGPEKSEAVQTVPPAEQIKESARSDYQLF